MKKKKLITVRSERYEADSELDTLITALFEKASVSQTEDMSLFSANTPQNSEKDGKSVKPEIIETQTDGLLDIGKQRVRLIYKENDTDGLEGCITSLGFTPEEPGLLTVLRSGTVSTALVFEEGKRHICVYNTPLINFEVCVFTRKVENKLLEEGTVLLDYFIELRGCTAEHTLLTVKIADFTE